VTRLYAAQSLEVLYKAEDRNAATAVEFNDGRVDASVCWQLRILLTHSQLYHLVATEESSARIGEICHQIVAAAFMLIVGE
jgi:hypothetical protein